MTASIISENTVKKIYQTVIDEVISNIREAFLDEGYDEILLQELKSLWETKLNQSRAIAHTSSNEDTASTTTATTLNAAASGSSNDRHQNHHVHHHATATMHVSPQPNSGMRLPITTTTTTGAKIVHQIVSKNVDTIATAQQASVTASRSQTASPGPVDIKPNLLNMMDPATRAAFQALPQHLYATTHQAIHQHQQQQQQQHQSQDKHKKLNHMSAGSQLDGQNGGGSSSEDEDDDLGAVGSAHDDDDDDNVDDEDEKATANNDDPSEYEGKEDPDPLNSGDDLTEPSTPDSNSDLFDTENVIVCQYDKITRIKNKWKFHLKDGIMNINGKDYLFSKANGDAEW